MPFTMGSVFRLFTKRLLGESVSMLLGIRVILITAGSSWSDASKISWPRVTKRAGARTMLAAILPIGFLAIMLPRWGVAMKITRAMSGRGLKISASVNNTLVFGERVVCS